MLLVKNCLKKYETCAKLGGRLCPLFACVSSTCRLTASLRCYWAADRVTWATLAQDSAKNPCRFSPQLPLQKGPVSSHSKCLRNTQSIQEMSPFLSIDFILLTKFKPGYYSLLSGEYYTASLQDCQILCFRIPLPSCTLQSVIQLKTSLLYSLLQPLLLKLRPITPSWFFSMWQWGYSQLPG